jgi:chromosome segregation ATPase
MFRTAGQLSTKPKKTPREFDMRLDHAAALDRDASSHGALEDLLEKRITWHEKLAQDQWALLRAQDREIHSLRADTASLQEATRKRVEEERNDLVRQNDTLQAEITKLQEQPAKRLNDTKQQAGRDANVLLEKAKRYAQTCCDAWRSNCKRLDEKKEECERLRRELDEVKSERTALQQVVQQYDVEEQQRVVCQYNLEEQQRKKESTKEEIVHSGADHAKKQASRNDKDSLPNKLQQKIEGFLEGVAHSSEDNGGEAGNTQRQT